jgi:hypothetical protein
MGFKINVDRFGFAKEPKPEKNSRDYAAELAKSLIDKEETDRMNEDAVLLDKITAEESARATAIEQLQEETDRKLTAESNARETDKAELQTEIDRKITAESNARETDKAELQTEIDDRITGEVVARNDAINEAIDEEVTNRNDAIDFMIAQEASARIAKDTELEEAIRAEESTRQSEVSNLSGMIDAKADKAELEGLKALSEFELIESGTLNENVNAIVPDLKGNRYKEIYCYLRIRPRSNAVPTNRDGRIYITNSGNIDSKDELWNQQNWLVDDFDVAWEMSVHIKVFGKLCSTKVWFYKYGSSPYARTPNAATFAGGEAPFKQLANPYVDNIGILLSSKDGVRSFIKASIYEIWGVRAQ